MSEDDALIRFNTNTSLLKYYPAHVQRALSGKYSLEQMRRRGRNHGGSRSKIHRMATIPEEELKEQPKLLRRADTGASEETTATGFHEATTDTGASEETMETIRGYSRQRRRRRTRHGLKYK